MVRYTSRDLDDLLVQVCAALGIAGPNEAGTEGALFLRSLGGSEYEIARRGKPGKGAYETHIRGNCPTLAKMLMAARDFAELATKLRAAREQERRATLPDDGLAVLTMTITYNCESDARAGGFGHFAEHIVPGQASTYGDVLDYRYYVDEADEGDRDSLNLAIARREAIANGDI